MDILGVVLFILIIVNIIMSFANNNIHSILGWLVAGLECARRFYIK